MKVFKILFSIFLLILLCSPAIARDKVKAVVRVNEEFSAEDFSSRIFFTNIKEISLENKEIPQNSIIAVKVLETQKERRWHKSGYILCRAEYYIRNHKKIDLTKENLYLTARKYEKLDKKDAAITTTELVLSEAASIFVPGIDLAYYFTKGVIKKEEGQTRFKSGVHSAYENSIFWFWLKGTPIDLEENDSIILKEINEKRAKKLKSQIERRKTVGGSRTK